jgi:plasmid stabilization system protein ParE
VTISVAIAPGAESEIYDAAQFYDTESPGLGADFVSEIMVAVDWIVRYPEHGEVFRSRFRRKVVRTFPYVLFYSIKKDSIRILAVAHQKRRPFYWRQRV